MLFRRKSPPDWREKTRVMLWPRRSWARSGKYFAKRILRLTASPHAVSAGVAAGVFASFTPFLGLHFLIAFLIAYFIAGNLLAAAMGTFFGNPVSFPFIWGATYTTGNYILLGRSDKDGSEGMAGVSDTDWLQMGWIEAWEFATGLWQPVFKPMLIGAVPLGTIFAIVAYLLTWWASSTFRDARKKRMDRLAVQKATTQNELPNATAK